MFMSEKLGKEEPPEKQYPVRRICAWCNKDLGLADYTMKEPGRITHAMCEECNKRELGKMRKKSQEKDPKQEE